MPRPKPPAPLIGFHVKLPPNEEAALPAIVQRWAADLAAKLAAQGIHTPPPADKTAWLRGMIREQAARYGVEIAEPASAPPSAAEGKKKARKP